MSSLSQSSTRSFRTLSLRGVLGAIAALGLSFGLALTILGLLVASRLSGVLSDAQSLAVTFHVLVYILLSICAMVGLYSAVYKRRTVAQVFFGALLVQFIAGFGSGIFALYLLFQKQSEETIQTCLKNTNAHDSFGKQLCERSSILKGVSVALLVVICFIEISGLAVASLYSARLGELKLERALNNLNDEEPWKV